MNQTSALTASIATRQLYFWINGAASFGISMVPRLVPVMTMPMAIPRKRRNQFDTRTVFGIRPARQSATPK